MANEVRDEDALREERLRLERLEEELLRERQIGFALGLFQEEVTIRALLEALGQAVVIIDRFRTILLVNTRAEQMFGYSSSELIGKPHDLLLPARFFEIHKQHMSDYFNGPRVRPMGIGLDLYAMRKDGSEFPVEISLSFVNTQSGILVIALVSDISRRKQAEAELKEHAEELARINSELESFSYSVSHDLKAPLRSLISFSRILLNDYSGGRSATEKDLIRRIENGAARMAELIDDMLQLSKIGRQEMHRRETNISEMARGIVDELRAASPGRNVETVLEDNVHASVDPGLFRIALTNLLGNAWKFTSATDAPRIEFGTIRKDGTTVYFVKDNGAGFDMAYSAKLFVPFQRLHSEREFPGTGIGLAIVERVITRHGGKVWAEGEPGKGATFWFTL